MSFNAASPFNGRLNVTLPRKLLVLAVLLGSTASAAALTQEAARENCRMTVGKPIVQACMHAGGGADREACRAKASPQVHACVLAALNAANGRANVAVELPKEAAPKLEPGTALPKGFIAPPRTISDITAILDSEKPNEKLIAELKADADSMPTGKEGREDLAQFYFDRANARAQLGRLAESIADANKAIEAGRGGISPRMMGRLMQLVALQYSAAGDPKKSVEMYQRQLREITTQPGAKGYQFSSYRAIAGSLIQMGDVAQAEAYLRRSQAAIQEARTSGLPGWRASYAKVGQNWESEIEGTRAMIFEARGQFSEAEASYRLTEQRKRAGMKGVLDFENPPAETVLLQAIDLMVLSQARMKARQGRLAEAEVDARRALLSRLKDTGKYNPVTPRYVMGLAGILVDEGRYEEAEQLGRVALEINKTVGVPEDSQSTVQLLSQLAGILNLRRNNAEANDMFARIDKAVANWDPQRRQVIELNPARILALYNSGQLDDGIAAAEQLVKKQIGRVGENHFDAASARGTLAIGLMRARRDADAIREFKAAIPIMMANANENADDENTTVVAARSQRLQAIVESYLLLLSRAEGASGSIGEETFGLADAIRGRSVQQALAASSARAAAKDPALAELVRKEQDLTKQVNAQLGTLNNVLAIPSAERDEKGAQQIQASIAALRGERDKARQEIKQKFPVYADLVSPKPPSVAEIRATLSDNEAMLSFYFGQNGSFVWAVPKSGPVAFAAVKAGIGDIETKIRMLREALEPQAAMISDIPPFDLKLGYELYELLLKPVESGWKPAKNLIVVTNGALGLLPLSLLPTAPTEVAADEDPLFVGYRNVPWLARTHAVSTVPSAAALRTLRQLPPGKPGRGDLVAFGDPYFNKDQQAEAESADAKIQVADVGGNVTRGVPLKRRSSPKLEGVDSAELGLLPRLPDTADELKSIALALQADPSKVLFLGKNATESAVKTMNLSGFRIIAFATHGLVPGELNGLTQPALALSSPAVTGDSGDGLLTMEEILGLKLDADWVILSACNTGAGAGAGAEAASGLGRAFFYAGTRALLVTNWSVHSQSARQLVTDLFKRQADDPKLSRSEALRQAMMALVDGPGYLNSEGKTEFAYAHPLFWAPYTIIGDGGVR
ncbi:CHAT domain-containing tetratricopeptide repeat protein [Bradyrhizobium sp. BR13661]|jgi:CHAT domain-containing protein|uniref:CHAT domain-containing protein n=1 Tax=Bradyrhizobium sp. BR13661 TaxID=2940622 RepID=UPI002472FBBF|nr:CHAT domain-containing tetratricopeptide repeat protein [Bradyrhizobium sp. BR13661]MDH6259563.1 CHAT domain-containing protein [Bradyrhizobium sp. BR13661]